MVDTTFVPHNTPVVSTWAQDINNFFYRTFGAPTTAAQALTAIGGLSTTTAAATYAPINSPTFTGTPTLPTGTVAVTQTTGNNTTRPATTAFVQNTVAAYAPLASPVFTGTPSIPTGTTGVTQSNVDSTTKIATTAFVQSVALGSGGLPLTQMSNVLVSQVSAANITTTINSSIFDNVVYDDLSEISYLSGNTTFTATNSGTYHFTLTIGVSGYSPNTLNMSLSLYNSSMTLLESETNIFVNGATPFCSIFLKMVAGQKAQFGIVATAGGPYGVLTDNNGLGYLQRTTQLSILRVK